MKVRNGMKFYDKGISNKPISLSDGMDKYYPSLESRKNLDVNKEREKEFLTILNRG